MKIVFIDTYYDAFLKKHYKTNSKIKNESYSEQLASLLSCKFGTSDAYSFNLCKLGWEAKDLIANCRELQSAWAHEHPDDISSTFPFIPHRYFRTPYVGPIMSNRSKLIKILISQIKSEKPDVLFCHDLSLFSGGAISEIKKHVGLLVGQIASPLPPTDFIKGYDLILTSFPHFVSQINGMGIKTEYFRIGFDERILDVVSAVKRDLKLSFVGGFTRHHDNSVQTLEKIAEQTEISVYGYGYTRLRQDSPLRKCYRGEAWGLDAYKIMARSEITINRHIDIAKEYANNMRMFEATGLGSLLLTDRKSNIKSFFEIGSEALEYGTADEAIEILKYLNEHPKELAVIAANGQRRTLAEHGYFARMKELSEVLKRYL